MPVKMQPTSVIKAHLGIEPNGRVQRFFANTCYKRMDKYVPKREGVLRGNVTVKSDSITYNQPYAHAQYVGFTKGPVNPDNYTIPGTGPYWDKRMVSAEMYDVIREVQDYIGGK